MPQKSTKKQPKLSTQLPESPASYDDERLRFVAGASTRSLAAVPKRALEDTSKTSESVLEEPSETSQGDTGAGQPPWSNLDPHAKAKNKGSYSTTLRLNDYDAARLKHAAIKEERNQQQLIRIAIRREVARILGDAESDT